MTTTPELDPAALARQAAEDFTVGDYERASAAALVSIAAALAEREPEPLPSSARPVAIDPLDAYRMWLEQPGVGDELCTCGHTYAIHLADLSDCAICAKPSPLDRQCTGFTPDRTVR